MKRWDGSELGAAAEVLLKPVLTSVRSCCVAAKGVKVFCVFRLVAEVAAVFPDGAAAVVLDAVAPRNRSARWMVGEPSVQSTYRVDG